MFRFGDFSGLGACGLGFSGLRLGGVGLKASLLALRVSDNLGLRV